MSSARSCVTLEAENRTCEGICHRCGTTSERVHGRYRRTLMDAPLAGRAVTIRLWVRRFRCQNADCPQTTFTEQIPQVTRRHARRTILAGSMLAQIALVLAGRAGARLASGIGLPVERDTMIRMVRRLPDPSSPENGVQVLGVDDFALRRGHIYGTVLIDLDTHRPLDLLPDREAQTFSNWLRERGQNVQVICRDRAGAYAQAARQAAPSAVQVADRWHLWHNLAGHVERAVKRLRDLWKRHAEELLPSRDDNSRAPVPVRPVPPQEPAAAGEELIPATGLDARHQQRWHAIHDLLDQGLSLQEVVRRSGLSRGTVRVFARAARPEDLYSGPRAGRGRELDQHRDFLIQQWTSGVTNGAALLDMLRQRGYRGQGSALRQYIHPWRIEPPAIPAARITGAAHKPLTVRELTRWLCTRPEELSNAETVRMQAILDNCRPVAELAAHITSFAAMMTKRTGDRDLNPWIATITASTEQPDLTSFARGLLSDYDAVRAGLSLPHSSGAVEGHNTRIKMIKRRLYGRAGLDLLRKMVLLGP